MTLFKALFARPHRAAGQPHFPANYDGTGCWWFERGVLPLGAAHGFNVDLVGEMQWQDNLSALTGGRCEEGHNCHFPAQLVFDDNSRDPNAIGVMIDHRAVGWVPSEMSADLRPAILRLNPEGKPVTCKAKVMGGWDRGPDDRGYFGVKLSISMPLKRAVLSTATGPD